MDRDHGQGLVRKRTDSQEIDSHLVLQVRGWRTRSAKATSIHQKLVTQTNLFFVLDSQQSRELQPRQ